MTITRLFAIGFIFGCITVAWFILGGVTLARTGDTNTALAPRVQELWGPPLIQSAPHATYTTVDRPSTPQPLPLESSEVKADLHLDYRQKGLLWYSTYAVDMDGKYRVVNPLDQPVNANVRFDFPSANTLYDNFSFEINGKQVLPDGDLSRGLTNTVTLAPRQAADVRITYKSRGVDRWTYKFGAGIANVKNYTLTVNTDFKEFDFPPQTVSASTKQGTANGWTLQWKFDSLVAGFQIGVEMPKKTQPGPLASRMSFFAPVSLLFFFTVLVILGAVRGNNLHPMHYIFLGASFFSFHLLFAYLADQVSIEISFIAAAIVSLVLIVSYVGRMSNWQFALREVGTAQCLFLILFSYAFFYDGYTGLVITIGAIITLAILMQLTAKVDWEQVFRINKAENRKP